ncbi:hypothetical protein BDZ88DRAFT_427780 [Geranomyces variabilis]|nr:hypothetical protein BDZ88DRAFT_427780 [Geranomyces variabilis]
MCAVFAAARFFLTLGWPLRLRCGPWLQPTVRGAWMPDSTTRSQDKRKLVTWVIGHLGLKQCSVVAIENIKEYSVADERYAHWPGGKYVYNRATA